LEEIFMPCVRCGREIVKERHEPFCERCWKRRVLTEMSEAIDRAVNENLKKKRFRG
jgi:NMD protein affecting ribosome stability and mRNA decay